MSIETLGIVFAVLSAVANIAIALIAMRGRWWEKADKIDALIDTLRSEAQAIRADFTHLMSEFHALRDEFREFKKDYSMEIRELQSRNMEIERRLIALETIKHASK